MPATDSSKTNATPWTFKLRSSADLAALNERLGLHVEAQDDLVVLARPLKVGHVTVPNRLAIQPMEGCDGDSEGRPGPLTIRRYERFAAGGAGLLWMEATAVVPEGRANPRQLWLNETSKSSLADLTARIRRVAADAHGSDHRPMLVVQLTHSGRYSKPNGVPAALMAAHNPARDAVLEMPRDGQIVTDDYLDSLVDSYVEAAKIAIECGFDALDVKACHGYLLNELLGAHTREGRHGGALENRTRLMLAIVDALRAELPDACIVTRLNVYDAMEYPYGWGVSETDVTTPDLAEPKQLIGQLVERGVAMVDVTGGNPYFKPHYNRPFNAPVVGGYLSPEHPLAGVQRLLDLAGEIQQAFPDLPVIGSGYTWLRTLLPNVAAAAISQGRTAMAGIGRMAFAYPDFAADILTQGKMDPKKVCVACSACTQMMRDGGQAGCVVRDAQLYRPMFRRGRLADPVNLRRLAEQCRHCNEATCTQGCPAGVDISGFISEFGAGNDREAYEILRGGNAFPLVCAELCPVEQQCQGHCLQNFIGDAPLPIADIQRHLSVLAIKNGWSKLRVPAQSSGRRVAVVGAGPAGLACAAGLVEAGHSVTVFDRADLGGMITATIPNARVRGSLGEEIRATFDGVDENRLTFKQAALSAQTPLSTLVGDEFDAVFIGLGLSEAAGVSADRPLGVTDALTFLRQAKQEDKPEVRGKTVAVIGGGNTALDAAITATRLGARDVHVLYRRSFNEMPAWPTERTEAVEAGVHIQILIQPLGYEPADGRLAMTLCPTVLGDADESGRRRPKPMESSAYRFDVDLVIEAIGQTAPAELAEWLDDVEVVDGLIGVNDDMETTRAGTFAGGDIIRGPDTVVAAIADGMKAARSIDRRLAAGTGASK